jgi:Leucine-rich repeat (LRR) protein
MFAICDRVIKVEVTGDGLSQLSDLPNLKSVAVPSASALSSQQTDALRELRELETLDLSNCYGATAETKLPPPTDSDDSDICLPPMPHLRGLSLYGAGFSGDGLEHLTAVEVLDLTDTDVRDDAMPKLATMRNLKSLSLAGTKITDAGLEHLKGLTQLRSLWLGGRGARPEGVTTEGIRRLQRSLPDCKIK